MSGRNVVSSEDILGGEPFLQDTRIRVSDIAVKYEDLGYSLDEIVDAYEQLDYEDIEMALNYFYQNKELFKGVSAEA